MLLILLPRYTIIEIQAVIIMELPIDQFTQCLVDTKSGEHVDTVFSRTAQQDIRSLTNWAFDWQGTDLENAEIYKLSVAGSTVREGLVAL